MKTSRHKHRYVATRLLVLLMFGSYSWRTIEGDGIRFLVGPAARLLKVTVERLKSHLDWLVRFGYLAAELQGRSALVRVRRPDIQWSAA